MLPTCTWLGLACPSKLIKSSQKPQAWFGVVESAVDVFQLDEALACSLCSRIFKIIRLHLENGLKKSNLDLDTISDFCFVLFHKFF
jgi:hypothetical protein